MNDAKIVMAKISNPKKEKGSLADVIKKADVFIGVSAPGVLTSYMIESMNDKPIVFAMANPVPEIMPDIALKSGTFILATGRSDFPNQINNVLAFPGLMKGALSVRASTVNDEMKIAAAEALAGMVENPVQDKIIPGPFDKDVAKNVTEAVMAAAIKTKVNRI
jgi:malate dehydrogenase (oxaloacetate-decarboxylating)